MARRVGSVFVSVEADTSLFRAEAMAGIRKSLAGIDGKIPVTADTAQARTQVTALKARMTDLSRQLAEVKIGANGKPAEASIRKLQLQLKELADTVASISIGGDTTRLDLAITKEEGNLAKLNAQASHLTLDANEKKLAAKIAAAEAGLERLNEEASGLVIDADDKRMRSQIADMERQAFHLRAALGDPEAIILGVDKRAMEAKIASLDANILVLQDHMTGMVMDADDRALLRKIYAAEAELAALRALGDVPLIADAVALDAAIAASTAKLGALRAEAADLKIGGKADLSTLATAEGKLLGLEEAAKRLNPELAATNARLVTGARGFGRFGLGALAARVALFGGLSAVSGWHIALDAVIEGLAVIVPALVVAAAGLAAFGIAGSDAARAVYNRLQNIHTVADALNQTIPPMTGHLEDLHKVVRPQVWQLYGDAIAVAHTKTGLFEDLAVRTGGVVDTLAARLTVLATTSGSGLDKFLASGARDLKEFGRIFLSLGDAFGKLIQVTEQTHIAEILLNIVGAAAKMFDIFTKIPLPILATVIALHGIYLWSGLAASGITALLRPFGRLAASAAGAKLAGTAVKDLAAAGNDSRLARLGATFSDLGTNLKAIPGRALSAAKAVGRFLISPWGLVAVGVAALGVLVYALYKSKSATDRFIDSINTMVAHSTDFTIINSLGAGLIQTNTKLVAANSQVAAGLKAMRDRMHSASAEAVQYGSNQNQVVESTRQLTAEHNKLVGQLTVVTGHLSFVTEAFGTDGLAGAMALAHLAGVGVDELLSKDSTVWAAAVQKIAGVVQGYANMGVGATGLGNAINVLTIAQSDQLKNMESLNSAFDQFDKIVSGPVTGFLSFANTLKRFGSDAGVAGAKMTGLGSGFKTTSKKMTDASLQLQNDFQDTFNSATQMADAMRLTGTASSAQVSAIKDVVQVMIPMAGSSKVAAAEISALAQEAGGPATTNLKDLGKWAGKTKDPLGAAQKAASDAAISFFDMSKDAQKLGTTLSQDLTKDMSAAVQNAVGLQGAMNDFAKSVHNGTQATAAGHKARQNLVDDLAAVNITGPQADSIIKAITSQLDVNGRTALATHKARQSINDDIQTIMNRGPVAKRDLMDMTKAIIDHGIGSDKERSARQKLIDDLHATGLKSKDATGLVDGLIRKLLNVPKKVATDIEVHAGGSGTVVVTGKGTAAGQGNVRFTSAARGAYIAQGTTPTADDVLARVSKGELIVPANMVAAGAVDHLRGKLPGFAGGGFVGIGNRISTAPGAAAGIEEKLAAQAMFTDVKKALDAAQKAANQAGISVPTGAVGGGVARWAPLVRKVLAYEHLNPGFIIDVLYQMMTESGGNPNAINLTDINAQHGDPSRGLMQTIMSTFLAYHWPGTSFNIYDPEANIAAALNYGAHNGRGFGTGPGQIGSGHGYAAGGLVPGYASGGSVGALRSRLAGEQRSERAKYFGLVHSFAVGPAKDRTRTVVGELSTLAARQQSEQAAYAAVAGGGLSNAELHHLGATARAETRTASDQGLNKVHPLFARDLRKYLAQIDVTSSGNVPTGGTGGAAGGPPALTPALRSKLAAAQAGERAKYFGLEHSFAIGPAKYRTKLTVQELATLAARQASELAAYRNIAGAGFTRAGLTHLGAAARSELGTASDKELSRNQAAGGHPIWAADLRKFLARISTLAGTPAKAPGPPPGSVLPGGGIAGPPLPKITHTFGGDVGNVIAPILAAALVPLGAARGGLIMDRGGWLQPGWNPPIYNGTGRPERVTPGGGCGEVTVRLQVDAGSSGADQFLAAMIKKYVKVSGGGNVQKAYGAH